MKIYFYGRVSKQEQNLENQRIQLYDYLKKKNINYNSDDLIIIEEKISGYKTPYIKRKIGTEILPLIKKNDMLIVCESSRIVRRVSNLLKFVEEEVYKIGFSLHIIKNGLVIDGVPNMMNKMILTVMGMCSEMEIDYLRNRIKQGIKRKRQENGNKWGRPKGIGRKKLEPYKEDIKKYLEIGVTQKKLAQIYEVCETTMNKYVKINKFNQQQ